VHLSLAKAVFLGALQGATEFLPVSSSGHLVIAQDILGVNLGGEATLAFDVCLHFGTLIALLLVFWRDIGQIFISFFGKDAHLCDIGVDDGKRLGIMVIIATIPAVIAALLFADFFESLIRNALSASIMLLVTGTILWFTRFAPKAVRAPSNMGVMRSIAIGCAQAVAIIPGISRSGSTISAGFFLGLDRNLAARFSFLMAVPAIAGAMVLEMKSLVDLSSDMILSIASGTIAAAVVGFLCIKWLLSIISRGKFSAFAYYCWGIGIVGILYKLFANG